MRSVSEAHSQTTSSSAQYLEQKNTRDAAVAKRSERGTFLFPSVSSRLARGCTLLIESRAGSGLAGPEQFVRSCKHLTLLTLCFAFRAEMDLN